MKKILFFSAATLLMFSGFISLFAAGVPEMDDSNDTLLCISKKAVNSTGDDEAAYIENFNLRIQGPETRTITIYPGSTNHYTKGLRPGNYTAVEFSSVNKESGATMASRAINIPFTIRAGYITIFPAEVTCELTKVYGALRQSGEVRVLTSSESRAVLNDVKSTEEFSWGWDTASYDIPYAQGGSLAGTGIKQAQKVPEETVITPVVPSSYAGSGSSTPVIAVMDFSVMGAGVSETALINDVFDTVINSNGRFDLVCRGEREMKMREAGYDPESCVSPECRLRAARALRLDHFISGTITKSGRSYTLKLSRVDARSGADARSYNQTFDSFEILFAQLPDIAEKLVR